MLDTKIFKDKLQAELALVEEELAEVARKNPENPNDWEPTETKNADHIDNDSVADNLEDFQGNVAITEKLEAQYEAIKTALEKIKMDTYGVCEVGGEMIPDARLEANPSAKTCIEHAK